MTLIGATQIILYLVVLVALVKPLGAYMARVYQGQPCGLDRPLGWLERGLYRVCRVNPDEEMSWQR
jgi:K+-transporting ATPase ATPase A chain